MSPSPRRLLVLLLALLLAVAPLRMAQAGVEAGGTAPDEAPVHLVMGDGGHAGHCGSMGGGDDGGCAKSGCDHCAACGVLILATDLRVATPAPRRSATVASPAGPARHLTFPPLRPPRA